MEDDVAETAIPEEPRTPQARVLPEAPKDELSTLVPGTSQLQETDGFYKAFVEPIFAEDTPDLPDQTTENLLSLVIRDDEVVTAEHESDKMKQTEPRSRSSTHRGSPRASHWQRGNQDPGPIPSSTLRSLEFHS